MKQIQIGNDRVDAVTMGAGDGLVLMAGPIQICSSANLRCRDVSSASE